MNEITLNEFKDIFKYVILNNRRLVDEGKNPVCISSTGSCGIGKTSIVQELASELGMTFVKVNLAELEEVSDLCGFPLKEYEIEVNSNIKWIPSDLLQTYTCRDDVKFTGNTRMGYATPAWLPRNENPNGVILLLDDFSRANQLFMQATMELINTGKYISWSLPKYTNICLTSNPDDSTYSVSSLDPAQKSRFIDFNIRFSIDNFAEWSERYGMDGRCVNFAIYYNSELFDPNNENHLATINPRSFTTFSNVISGIQNWDKPESLALILNISKGCFHDQDNIVGSLFTNFIANKLDKLVSPEDMLLKKWERVKEEIESCVFDSDDNYHPEIAAVLHTRLLNYSVNYLANGNKSDAVCERLVEMVDNSDSDKEKHLFSEDLLFSIIKTIVAKFPAKTNKLLLNPAIRKKIL